MAKTPVSLIIPVYNEEKNIERILLAVQKQTIFQELKEVLVISDSSNDRTHDILKGISKNTKKIRLIVKRERKGKFDSMRKSFSLLNSDIIIILDADVSLSKDTSLSELISPFSKNDQIGITVLKNEPLKKKITWASTASLFSIYLRHEIIKLKKDYHYDNFQTLCGRTIAIKKELYKKIEHLYDDPGDDQNLFFLTIKNKLRVYYVDSSSVRYNVPLTINDYLKQNIRYRKGLKAKDRDYGRENVDKYTKVGPKILIALFLTLIKHPLAAIAWAPLYILGYFSTIKDKKFNSGAWEVSESTK
ncbi:MAG: glycosyltransferase family 2 protein [Candidatus Pacearchaeota archaeon]|jgi:cellulose synthase/poly-beta-1,6-N-acetylglucosamine synthase-like glycosyltransferase